MASVFALILLKQKTYLKLDNIRPSLIMVYLLAPALVLFSYTGYFFVLLPAYNLFLSRRPNKRNRLYLAIYLLSLLLFSCISYNFDLKYTLREHHLRHYWDDHYIYTTSFFAFIKSFGEGIRNIFVRWFINETAVRRIMTFFLPFSFLAMIFLGWKQIREDRGLILSLKSLTLFLFIALCMAGALKIYPFTGGRVTLFICPFIFYAMIKGIEMFKNNFFRVYLTLLTIYTLTLFSTSLYLLHNYLSMSP